MDFTRNDAKRTASESTSHDPDPAANEDTSEEATLSPEYLALQARMDADEMWDSLSATERLPVILDHFAVEEWFGLEALPTIAIFRQRPAGRWGQIRARFKAIGGNPFDLQEAVDTLLKAKHEAHAQETITPARRPEVTTMSTVQAEPIPWLWWPYIAVGKLCMLDGDPGIGKSLLMTQLAASLSRGYPLPDQQGKPTMPTGDPQTTLLLSTEDGLADTLRPRLDAAGADCSKVHVLTGWLGPEDELHALTLQHIDVLSAALQQYQPRMIIIDPIQAYLGQMDMHRANETRPLLAALTRLAEKYHCAVVCIRHPSKPGQSGGKAIHRGLGSIDFIGAARTGLFVEQHPTDPGKVLLAQTKSNIGMHGRTQVFTKHEGHFQWCGVSRLSAELMAGSGRGPDPTACLEAVCWLEQRLEGGLAWPSADLEEEMLAEGYKRDTIRKAKKALGVVSKQTSTGWTWRLDPLPILSPPSPTTTPVTALSGTTAPSALYALSGESLPSSPVTESDTAVTAVMAVTGEGAVTGVVKGEAAPDVEVLEV